MSTPTFCALCGSANRDPRPWDARCAMCPDCEDREFVAPAAPAGPEGPEGLGVPQEDPDPSSEPSGDGLVDREVIARVIDPHEWELHDFAASREPPAQWGAVAPSLLKADRIVTLLGGRSDSSALIDALSDLLDACDGPAADPEWAWQERQTARDLIKATRGSS